VTRSAGAFRDFADPREINRTIRRARKRRVCDNSIGRKHFIQPGEPYERIVVIHQGFCVYARCDACLGGWDGFTPYPGSPALGEPEVAS
jgi:hypothetical protein